MLLSGLVLQFYAHQAVDGTRYTPPESLELVMSIVLITLTILLCLRAFIRTVIYARAQVYLGVRKYHSTQSAILDDFYKVDPTLDDSMKGNSSTTFDSDSKSVELTSPPVNRLSAVFADEKKVHVPKPPKEPRPPARTSTASPRSSVPAS
jgi:hypothetical protein